MNRYTGCMPGLEAEAIRHLLEAARKGGFAEVEIEHGGGSFRAILGPARPKPAQAIVEGGADPISAAVVASCVGYFRPADSKLTVGHRVEKGEIVASINALGLANDVESPLAGEIVEVFVSADQAVEYGQPLAMIRPLEI